MTTTVAPTVRLRTSDVSPVSSPVGQPDGASLVGQFPAGRQYSIQHLDGGGMKVWMLPAGATADAAGLPSVAEIQRINSAFWGSRNGRR